MLRLLGVKGEEQEMLPAQNSASEEERSQWTMQATERPLAPPGRFLCPITLEIMSDPVIVMSGQIYERSAIERWLVDHDRCPVTRFGLDPNVVFRVLDLRAEIAEWVSSNRPARIPVNSSSAEQFPLRLETRNDDGEEIPSSTIARLVSELDKDGILQLLTNMAYVAANRRAIAAVPGSLQKLVGLLESGSEGVQKHAAWALWTLANDAANQEAIAAVPGSLQGLVTLLESGHEILQRVAAGALFNLAVNPANKKAIAAVPGSLRGWSCYWRAGARACKQVLKDCFRILRSIRRTRGP